MLLEIFHLQVDQANVVTMPTAFRATVLTSTTSSISLDRHSSQKLRIPLIGAPPKLCFQWLAKRCRVNFSWNTMVQHQLELGKLELGSVDQNGNHVYHYIFEIPWRWSWLNPHTSLQFDSSFSKLNCWKIATTWRIAFRLPPRGFPVPTKTSTFHEELRNASILVHVQDRHQPLRVLWWSIRTPYFSFTYQKTENMWS